MSGHLVDTITTATNNDTIYCLDNFFDNKPPLSIRWRANPSFTLESGWLPDHPGTQLPNYPAAPLPVALSNGWICDNRRPGPGRPSHTQRSAALLFSHHSNLQPPDGNTTPGPHRAAISVFPPGLGLDISCLVISHHRQDIPLICSTLCWQGNGQTPQFNMHAGERERWRMGIPHTVTSSGWQQVSQRTHPRWSQGSWTDSSPSSSVTLVQYLTSTNLFSICEMGAKVTNLKETQCGPKGIRHWNYQIITVIFFPLLNKSMIISTFSSFPGEFRHSINQSYVLVFLLEYKLHV